MHLENPDHLPLTNNLAMLNVDFSFEKGLNGQNHSAADTHDPLKYFQQVSYSLFLMLFGKPWLLLLTKNLAMLNFYLLKSHH